MPHLKRFLVSWGETYYPRRGMGDFVHSFDTLEEAKKFIESKVDLEHLGSFKHNRYIDWVEIFDSKTQDGFECNNRELYQKYGFVHPQDRGE